MRCLATILFLFSIAVLAQQQPEINDQFETRLTKERTAKLDDAIHIEDIVTAANKTEVNIHNEITQRVEVLKDNEDTFIIKIYNFLTEPIVRFVSAPKVNAVLRNVGTCIVNGAMEIIAYYLPAPMIPLLASAAGMVIPFEPVVMLKQKMPVNSYRRAFKTALNSFMNTFDKYKLEDDFDPYMTRRFNRRFMNNDNGGKDKGNDK